MKGQNLETHRLEDLASLIKHHRKEAGLSQSDLADMAAVGKTLIYDLEKGHARVSFEKLESVLNVLNIKLFFSAPRVKR